MNPDSAFEMGGKPFMPFDAAQDMLLYISTNGLPPASPIRFAQKPVRPDV
ncbi:MAG: hypothetical protein MN733_15695 [Nitrososphaera sp.]|nr:hypothetical protein [Nitrososphaera sp.]